MLLTYKQRISKPGEETFTGISTSSLIFTTIINTFYVRQVYSCA